MRPVKLELEGFTSFAAPSSIDFTDLDLFAITGPTGAGKTSLIDAMLYALYGYTPRLGEKEVDRLLHLGAKSMHVCLTFTVQSVYYRITRTRKKATEVKLEKLQPDGEWTSIAGGVRQVDRHIPEILGLDFDGFTRAVVLPQGEFDKFLRTDPTKRTDMLKDLLGLRIYEFMMRRANEQAAECRTKAEIHEQSLAALYGTATPEALAQLLETMKTQKEQVAEYDAGAEQLTEFIPRSGELKRQREENARCETSLADVRKQLRAAREEGAAALRTREECERLMSAIEKSLQSVGYDEAAWVELSSAVPLARQQARVQTDLTTLRKDKQAKSVDLVTQQEVSARTASAHALARQQLGVAEEAAHQAKEARAGKPSPDLLKSQLKDVRAAETAMQALPAQEAMQEALAKAESSWEHLRTLHAAGDIRRHLKTGDSCPVCEQTIAKLPVPAAAGALEDARALVDCVRREKAHWDNASRRLEDARQRAGNVTEEDLKAVLVLDRAAQEAQQALDEARRGEVESARAAQSAQHRQQLLEQQVAAAEEQLRKAQDQLRETARLLAAYPGWAPLPLTELESSIEEQNTARLRHQALEQQRREAQSKLQKALTDSADRKGQELSLLNRIAELESAIAAGKEAAKGLEAQLGPYADLNHLQATWKQVTAVRDKMRGEIAQSEARIVELQRQIEEAAQRRAEAQRLRGEMATWHELGQLLKANEFIAFVQREALRGLAQAASEQLRQLSDGNYTLTLGDGANEFYVVDHRNGSELRSVKTLSGGESFLASLSLALALSEGLAGAADDRARARLDSLFIDEGISSLDPETLDTAITALGALADGKRMIGVISHIAELGERLPAQIRVIKGPTGSVARVQARDEIPFMAAGG